MTPMQPPIDADSCYLCEIGKEGLAFPMEKRTVLICLNCVLECIWAHPKLMHHRKVQSVHIGH